jgi:uncharacterized protein (TIGR03435 family)
MSRPSRNLWIVAAAIAAVLTNASSLAQQTPSGRAPDFAMVSIHKSHTTMLFPQAQLRPGQFVFRDGTADFLIQIAYGLQTEPVGGPKWVHSERFDLDARADNSVMRSWKGLSVEEQKARTLVMLRSLLSDRFHLQASFEIRNMPVYALVVAKGGPKLTPAGTAQPKLNLKQGWATILLDRATTTQFVQMLRMEPELQGREVIDQTELSGLWQFNLQWPPRPRVIIPTGPYAGLDGSDPALAPFGTSSWHPYTLFDELKRQLGLELIPEKAPIQVLAIQHIEKP